MSGYNNDFSISQVGLDLNKEQLMQLKSRLRYLENQSPSMSAIHLRYKKVGNKWRGYLTINSYDKSFKSNFLDACPIKLYNLLEKDIEQQLMTWKKKRFLNLNLKVKQNNSHKQLTGGYAL